MNRAAERRGRGNGVHFDTSTTWQAFVAMMVTVVLALRELVKFIMEMKAAEEAVRWLATIFKRAPAGEVPFGGCYVLIDPSKWAFIVALVLLGVLLGLYIAYIFSRAIEQAQETLERFSNVFRRVMAAVTQFFGVDLFPAIEAAEVEGYS